MENIKDVICIYNENEYDIEDIILKIYEDFVEKELNEVFKS